MSWCPTYLRVYSYLCAPYFRHVAATRASEMRRQQATLSDYAEANASVWPSFTHQYFPQYACALPFTPLPSHPCGLVEIKCRSGCQIIPHLLQCIDMAFFLFLFLYAFQNVIFKLGLAACVGLLRFNAMLVCFEQIFTSGNKVLELIMLSRSCLFVFFFHLFVWGISVINE